MFKIDKADSGVSRVCRDIAEYALIAALILACVYVVLGSIVPYEERPERHYETPEVYADSGYARNVDRVTEVCQRAVQEVAEAMGDRAAELPPLAWHEVYWSCLIRYGATS